MKVGKMANKNQTYSFLTPRLLVKEWHSLTPNDWDEHDLTEVVTNMLTKRVTSSLPIAWQGAYTIDRARLWIEERDREGKTLLVISRSTRSPIGMMILFESVRDIVNKVEIRLGYLLKESSWGKGFASELVRGFVDWCRENNVASIIGGVDRENIASRRVLEKNGFVCILDSEEDGSEEIIYQLQLSTY
jgi:RimJ/RimL family protein N-acetyltransferase